MKPMKNVIDNQLKLRKKVNGTRIVINSFIAHWLNRVTIYFYLRLQIEGNVEKTSRSLAEWRTNESKSKKNSHTAARENEKLQDATLDIRYARFAMLLTIRHHIFHYKRRLNLMFYRLIEGSFAY